MTPEERAGFEAQAAEDSKRFESQVKASSGESGKKATRAGVLRRAKGVINRWRFAPVSDAIDKWLRNMFVDLEMTKANKAASEKLAELRKFAGGTAEDKISYVEGLVTSNANLETELSKANVKLKCRQRHSDAHLNQWTGCHLRQLRSTKRPVRH